MRTFQSRLLALSAVVLLVTFGNLKPTLAQGWAVELGPSYDIQSGTFIAPCGCTFGNGNGLGWIGAISYDFVSFAGFSIGARVGMDLQQFTSKELTQDALQQIANGDQEKTTLTYLTIDPYLRYHFPGMGLFVQAAPGWEYLVQSDFQHVAGTAPSTDDTAAINPTAAVDVRKARINAKLSAGYSIGFLGIALEPMVTATLPLTDVSTSVGNDYRVTSWTASLALRFGM